MRVMWLTQLQLPGVTGAGSMGAAGWLDGLRWAIEQYDADTELGIVSWGSVRHAPLQRGRITYFSLDGPRPATRAQRLAAAWRLETVPREAVEDAVAIGRSFAPDLVHVHGTEHPLGLAALRLGRPAVATLQGVATALRRHVLGSVPPLEIARSLGTRDFLRGSSYLHWYRGMCKAEATERVILSGLHCFMGQTDWDWEVLKLINPNATYFRGPRVVQQQYYSTEWRGPHSDGTTLFCTSSPAPYKGLETLLEALGLLSALGRRDIRLRVAGDVPGSMMWPWLRGVMRRQGVEGLVTWLGPLPADAVARELAEASAFVLPSHIENESNALIEAMLVGLPCIASAVGGVPSVVRDEVTGLLFNDTDPFALATAILRIADDMEFARTLAVTARSEAQARWEPKKGAHDIRAVYDAVLADRRGSLTVEQRPTPGRSAGQGEQDRGHE